MTEITQMLLELLLLGFVVATLEMAFQHFMMPNMFFYPYAVLLSKIASKGDVWRHLTSPFGRCPYCNSTWIAFYTFQYFYDLKLTVLLLFGTTYIFVYLMKTYIFHMIDPAMSVDSIYDRKYEFVIEPIPMLYTYLILGFGYFMVYVGVPFAINIL